MQGLIFYIYCDSLLTLGPNGAVTKHFQQVESSTSRTGAEKALNVTMGHVWDCLASA